MFTPVLATIEQEVAEAKAGLALVDITSKPRVIVDTAVLVAYLEDTTNTCLAVVACQVIMVVLQDIIVVVLLDIAREELQGRVIVGFTDHKQDFGTIHRDPAA